MFFWGSYNFQVTQHGEDDTKPPLRYPIYVPPCPSTWIDASQRNHNASAHSSVAAAAGSPKEAAAPSLRAETALDESLHHICHQRLRVKDVACGMKHALVLLELPNASSPSVTPTHSSGATLTHPPSASSAPAATSHVTLFGLGNNQHGQLGARVASYTHTLTHLRLEDVINGRVVSMACGARHTLLCTSTGSVYVSGDNTHGQLGLSAYDMAGVTRRTLSLGSSGAMSNSSRWGSSANTHLSNNSSGSGSTASRGGAATFISCFTQLTQLAHMSRVFACNNTSFALDSQGVVYAWGEAQYGHLCHNDKGERLDTRTLRSVQQNVVTPQRVRWFERQRVRIVSVAVGKAHVVCRSEEEVYTCGEGYFGKLGHGDVRERLEPTRVHFPPRKQPERLVDIAAGDDQTLVLKENSALGSVVYYFGKMSNMDGQLTPMIVPVPDGALTRVFAGRGNQSFALSAEGTLYAWGKHAYVSVYNGTGAAARRVQPHMVEVLERYRIGGLAVGGTFVIAYASDLQLSLESAPATDQPKHATTDSFSGRAGANSSDTITDDNTTGSSVANSSHHAKVHTNAEDNRAGKDGAHELGHDGWDVVVPHDLRVNKQNDGDRDNAYERGTQSFMRLYLGEALGMRYVAGIPAPPGRSAKVRFAFKRVGAHGLSVGQKVRLWMSDVYALGLVTKVMKSNADESAAAAAVRTRHMEACDGGDDEMSSKTVAGLTGQRVSIEWQRDDWHDEVLTLYSDDETYNEENANRWQPIWFAQNEDGSYVVEKIN